MIEVKDSVCKCTFCGKEKPFRLDWSEFKLPKDWRFRTRSFRDDHEPEEIQIKCEECQG